MTDAERELLLYVAKALGDGLDTPFKVRRTLQELVQKVRDEAPKAD